MSQKQQKTAPHDLKALTDMLLKLDDMLVSCMRCGFCMAVCPVFGATMREADVTRGKIALLENLAKQMTTDVNAVNEKLNRCLLCGSCQANCPSGVKIMDIFLRARAIVTAYKGLSPIKKAIFRGMLVRPGLFNALMGISSTFQGLFLRKASESIGTARAPMLKPVIGDRHFPRLARQTFHSRVDSLDSPAGASGLRVAFFPGCVSDKMFPGVAQATVKVLEKHGVGIFMPSGQSCCGIPALASGDRKSYDQLLRQNLKLFAGGNYDYLVTPCGTCTSTIKEFWPKLTEDYSQEERDRIAEISRKTMDISQFLVDVLKVELPEQTTDGKKVTYHDSCHLNRSLGVNSQPRALLKSLPGYKFVEMPEADRCCGSGGSFTLTNYELSKKIGGRKRDNIIAVNPDVVSAGCPACMMQLMDMLSQNGDEIPVKHVIELYADTL